jgi:hypothetical protein
MDVNNIWFGYYAIGWYPKIIIFNFLQLVKQSTQLPEFVRWNVDDAITHDRLRMRITNLT